MKVFLNNMELAFLFSLVSKTVQVTEAKNPKPHEESGKLLVVYKELVDKIKWVIGLPTNEGEITLNRVEAKALLGQLDISRMLLRKIKEKYETMPEDAAPFDPTKPSRTKESYIKNLSIKSQLIEDIGTKLKEKL